MFDWRAGTQNQQPMQWFSETITPHNVQAKVSPTRYTYDTTDEVDRVRVDFVFTSGLYGVDEKKGNILDATAALRMSYSQINGDGTFGPETMLDETPDWHRIDASTGTTLEDVSGLRITVQMSGQAHEPQTPYSIALEWSQDGSTWTNFAQEVGFVPNNAVVVNGQLDYVGGSFLRVFTVSGLNPASTSFRAGGCSIVGVEGFFGTTLTYTDRTRGAVRHSVTTPPLPRARYRFQFWRDVPESTEAKLVDAIAITDINQVKDDLIRYANTAFYGLQLRIGADIGQEPNVSALVRGKKLHIYDRNGAVNEYRYSDNPADVALDIMLNPRHRFAFNTTRIDFPAFDNWRKFCIANNLAFNGVFDAVTNVWDAMLSVMRVGRGSPILQGLRWSVLIEGPADPVMMFTQDNMIKGSFSTRWTGRKGRANLVEVQYFDKLDLYKQHSVFALDDSFIAQGEALVQSTIQLRGVSDSQQASKEATLQLNLNRYLTQAVDFDVYLQAMGCVVGDVVLLQHDMPAWGYTGRIIDNDTPNQVTIDSDVPFNGEGNWRMLLVRGTAQLCQGVVTSVSGKQIQVTGLTQAGPSAWDAGLIAYSGEDASVMNPVPIDATQAMAVLQANGIDRVKAYGRDYAVVDWAVIGGELVLVSDEIFQVNLNDPAQLFKNDLMCEAVLAAPQFNDRVLRIANWTGLYGAPRTGDIVMIGQVDRFKKPFRIMKITYKDDHVRTISALEYNDSVYGDNAHPTPNYSALQLAPYQVDNLRGKQVATQLQGGAMQYVARFEWDRPLNDPRGYGGANVYASVNYSPLTLVGDAPNPIGVYDIQGQRGRPGACQGRRVSEQRRDRQLRHRPHRRRRDRHPQPEAGTRLGRRRHGRRAPDRAALEPDHRRLREGVRGLGEHGR